MHFMRMPVKAKQIRIDKAELQEGRDDSINDGRCARLDAHEPTRQIVLGDRTFV